MCRQVILIGHWEYSSTPVSQFHCKNFRVRKSSQQWPHPNTSTSLRDPIAQSDSKVISQARGCHVQISKYSDGWSVLKTFLIKLLFVLYSLKIVYSAQMEQNSSLQVRP